MFGKLRKFLREIDERVTKDLITIDVLHTLYYEGSIASSPYEFALETGMYVDPRILLEAIDHAVNLVKKTEIILYRYPFGRYILVGPMTEIYDPVAFAPIEKPVETVVELAQDGYFSMEAYYRVSTVKNAEHGIVIVSPVGDVCWGPYGWTATGWRIHATVIPDDGDIQCEWPPKIEIVKVPRKKVTAAAQGVAKEVWKTERWVEGLCR